MNLKYDVLEITREHWRTDIRGWLAGHQYIQALWYLVIFLAAFYITERLVTPKYIISCPADDWIPFHEQFIVLYLMWFILLPASWLYTAVTSKEDFQNLFLIMFGGMTISIVIYWLFPNGLKLRPEAVEPGICGNLVRMIHAVDTPGNVCPSIHVSSSTAVAVVAYRSRVLKKQVLIQWSVYLLVVGISLSTMFLKQHSVIDVICGGALTGGLAKLVYRLPWRGWMKGTRMEFFL
ncbi:MAG: phosphatase PAP2 family protein [Lachnospiraceae bacterium]|jgi:membrane-associated phospholipid phosphatase|nr:phosphatase PAP2 family protein [Lachnospiraceae bacterium]